MGRSRSTKKYADLQRVPGRELAPPQQAAPSREPVIRRKTEDDAIDAMLASGRISSRNIRAIEMEARRLATAAAAPAAAAQPAAPARPDNAYAAPPTAPASAGVYQYQTDVELTEAPAQPAATPRPANAYAPPQEKGASSEPYVYQTDVELTEAPAGPAATPRPANAYAPPQERGASTEPIVYQTDVELTEAPAQRAAMPRPTGAYAEVELTGGADAPAPPATAVAPVASASAPANAPPANAKPLVKPHGARTTPKSPTFDEVQAPQLAAEGKKQDKFPSMRGVATNITGGGDARDAERNQASNQLSGAITSVNAGMDTSAARLARARKKLEDATASGDEDARLKAALEVNKWVTIRSRNIEVMTRQGFAVNLRPTTTDARGNLEWFSVPKTASGDSEKRAVFYDESPDEWARTAVKVVNGGLVWAGGADKDKPVNTRPFQTFFSKGGWAIFVMSQSGEIHLGSHEVGQYHHSSLLNGQNVAAAGEMRTSPSGKLLHMSNKSGHYTPGPVEIRQVMRALEKGNITPETYRLRFFTSSPQPQEFATAKEWTEQKSPQSWQQVKSDVRLTAIDEAVSERKVGRALTELGIRWAGGVWTGPAGPMTKETFTKALFAKLGRPAGKANTTFGGITVHETADPAGFKKLSKRWGRAQATFEEATAPQPSEPVADTTAVAPSIIEPNYVEPPPSLRGGELPAAATQDQVREFVKNVNAYAKKEEKEDEGEDEPVYVT
jgi:hypothetical protein